MKEKFRVVFGHSGWFIQTSRWGLLWRACGTLEYRRKEVVEKICENLNAGEAPADWYQDQSLKGKKNENG